MSSESPFEDEQFFISPAGKSQERADALLPSEGSEDVSHLLHQFSESEITEDNDDDAEDEADEDDGDEDAEDDKDAEDDESDYVPTPLVDWTIHVEFPAAGRTQNRINEVLGADWRNENDRPTVYGKYHASKRWTYLGYGEDADKRFSELKFAWKMRPLGDEEPISEEQFGRHLVSVEAFANQIGALRVSPECPPDEAEQRVHALLQFASECDAMVEIVLQAPEPGGFDGKAIWDVMLCLGLQWGDMDMVHWENPGVEGDDHLFSVWTSTPPGYFFPEEIAAGQVQTDDLVFGFSVPRTWRPDVVFDSMMNAARYAQKRLGGTILDAGGNAIADGAARADILGLVAKLTEAGFPPGSHNALYLF